LLRSINRQVIASQSSRGGKELGGVPPGKRPTGAFSDPASI
jgi:hypothetical protein